MLARSALGRKSGSTVLCILLVKQRSTQQLVYFNWPKNIFLMSGYFYKYAYWLIMALEIPQERHIDWPLVDCHALG